MQLGKGGGCCPERVKGAEQIVMKSRNRDLPGPDGSSGVGLCFEDEDIPARVSQQVGRHQSIGSGANHNGIDFHMSTLRTRSSSLRRASLFLM